VLVELPRMVFLEKVAKSKNCFAIPIHFIGETHKESLRRYTKCNKQAKI